MTSPSLAFTGSGSAGHVVSWSITEEATPVSIGSTSGGVGSLTVSAAATSDSIYLNDSPVTFTYGTREWTGRVNQVSLTGSSVSLTCESSLRVLTAVRTAPPVGEFVLPLSRIQLQSGSANPSVAWDSSGNLFVYDAARYQVIKYTPTGSSWSASASTPYTTTGTADGQFGGVAALACDASGNVYVADTVNSRIQRFTNSLAFSAKQGSLGSGTANYNNPQAIAYDAASGDLVVVDTGNLRTKRISTSLAYISHLSTSTDYTKIAIDSTSRMALGGNTLGSPEVLVQTSAGVPVATIANVAALGLAFDADGFLWCSDANTQRAVRLDPSSWLSVGFVGSYGSAFGQFTSMASISVDASGMAAVADYYAGYIQTLSGFSGNGDRTIPLSSAIEQYVALADDESTITVSYDAASDPLVAFPGWRDSVWTKLKQLCAAYGLEMTYTGGTLHFVDRATRTLDITNRTVPTVTPTSIAPTRSVNVVNYNTSAGDGVVMFDASNSGLNLTVDVGQTVSYSANSTAWAAIINNPAPVDGAPVSAGQYAIQDSAGLSVPAATWLSAGGRVSAYIDSSIGTVRIVLNGPSVPIDGFLGPFSLSTGSGGDRTPALILTGSGVTASPTVVNVPTGATPERVTDESVRIVDVPFVGDKARAYDAGVWTAATEYLFGQSISFSLPPDESIAFGDYVGRRFRYQDAMYRVTKAVHSAAKVDITAEWYTTVADFDAIWDGTTIADFDAAWNGRLVRDLNATPLRD